MAGKKRRKREKRRIRRALRAGEGLEGFNPRLVAKIAGKQVAKAAKAGGQPAAKPGRPGPRTVPVVTPDIPPPNGFTRAPTPPLVRRRRMLPIEVMDEMSEPFVHKRIIGGIKGALTGGAGGAVTGFFSAGEDERTRKSERARMRTEARSISRIDDGGPCPPLTIRGPRGTCIVLLAGAPGGRPMITSADGAGALEFGGAVVGAFGMPAIAPVLEVREHRSCPSGMVLGEDELCYPKEILRRNSRFRKWRPGMRPILTGGERRGITKARQSVNRACEAVGLASLK